MIDDSFLPPPAVLWVELTSKCPFDCKFCSRRLWRGEGEHMDFDLYRSFISQLRLPQIIRLNYSGESIHYPQLIEAVRLARKTGAWTEMVSAFASIPERQIPQLVESGLDRLTVSLHTMSPAQYRRLYGFSDLAVLRSKLEQLQQAKQRAGSTTPLLDFAFVALRENLPELPRVAAYAGELGACGVYVHPVLRRDPIPEPFLFEVHRDGTPRAEFLGLLRRAVAETESAAEGVPVRVCSPVLDGARCIGETPAYYPGYLPQGTRIHSCDQSPWETAHILANGDVVPCEVQDREVLGNLRQQALSEIWGGERYKRFRREYTLGRNPHCRSCPWKIAHRPGPLRSCIDARDSIAQLLSGWHGTEPDNGVVWSQAESSLLLPADPRQRRIQIQGLLPPSVDSKHSALRISYGGNLLALIKNPTRAVLDFRETFELPPGADGAVRLNFAVTNLFWPARAGASADCRGLGFALRRAEISAAFPVTLRRGFRRLEFAMAAVDAIGPRLRALGLRFQKPRMPSWRPGVSILIPERENRDLLLDCLASVGHAAANLDEPVEIIVAVNGSGPEAYSGVARQFPEVSWLFERRPLGFGAAIRRALAEAHYDWVYLLNNDMTLDPGALAAVLDRRRNDVFAIGSQIFFKDRTRRREETNWSALRIVDGQVELFEAEPDDPHAVRPSLYAGGGSSLFRKSLLESFIGASAVYDPFYWEDVEWGAVARRLGFEVLFCPVSQARHVHRATVAKFYARHEVDRVWRRNAILFQLRNLPGSTPLASVFERMRDLDEASLREILLASRSLLRARAIQYCYPVHESCLYAAGPAWDGSERRARTFDLRQPRGGIPRVQSERRSRSYPDTAASGFPPTIGT